MRFSADGYLNTSDPRRLRMPKQRDYAVEPTSQKEALAFLLSHTFPGHRRLVRAPSTSDRRKIQLALGADLVSERMTLVDRVWRAVTEPVPAPRITHGPQLVQVVTCGGRGYPLYLDGTLTRVLPEGGVSAEEAWTFGVPHLDIAED